MSDNDAGQERAITFCNLLLQALRLVRLYPTDNVAYEVPLKQMQALIAASADRGGMRIQAEEGMLYFNKEPLRGGKRAFGTIQGLVKGLEGVGIAELETALRVHLPLWR